MIALIHGPDAATARAEAARLAASHDPDAVNTSRFDGRETALSDLVTAIGSLGFFGSPRVVVVHDLMARAARGAGTGSTGDSDEAANTLRPPTLDLAPLFAAVPEQNLLILVDPTLTAIPATVKRAVPRDVVVVGAEPPRGPSLVSWLIRAAEEAGGEMDRQTAQFLAETLYPQTWVTKPANPHFDRPPDTELLRNEVEKLLLAAHPGPVTTRHIREMILGRPDERIFRFVEAAVGGQLETAVVELERLLAVGEEPAKLAAQIYQQVELAAVAAAGQRVDPVAIGRALGLSNPNRMVGVAASRRGRSADSAYAAVGSAVAVDRDLKRGRMRQPDDALYALLARATDSRPGT